MGRIRIRPQAFQSVLRGKNGKRNREDRKNKMIQIEAIKKGSRKENPFFISGI